MDSIVLSDMELCVLALSNNYNIKDIKNILPRNVKNRFRWKNNMYIKKQMNLVKKKFEAQGLLHSKKFNQFILGVFYPEQIYVLSRGEKIISQIRISEYGKFSFENVEKNNYEIVNIEEEYRYINAQIGFELQLIFSNIIYEDSFNSFKKIQDKFINKIPISEEEYKIYQISAKLKSPMWTLENHKISEEGKSINIIVWNKEKEKVEFCCTENGIKFCNIKIGAFNIS